MNTSAFELSQLSRRSETVELPTEVVGMLKAEARLRRKSIAAILNDWLQERAEDRAAEKALRAALKINKGKPSIAAGDLYRECGI